MSLHTKFAEVYGIVERIPKNGKAPSEMGGYAFVQVGDAADPIRKALAERQLTMLPTAIEVVGQSEHEDSRQRIVTTCDVRVTWTVTDGESGESATLQSMGSGQDRGDKYVPKALTTAMKYAILLGFLLPTGDEPEAARTDDRQARSPRTAPQPVTSSSPAGASVPEMFAGRVDKGRPPVDQNLRKTPDGSVFGFVLMEDTGGKYSRKTQVVCVDALAEAAATAFDGMGVPETATVWGKVEMVPWQKDGQDMKPFRRVHATRIETPDWTLPATDTTPAPVAAPDGPAGAVEDLSELPW